MLAEMLLAGSMVAASSGAVIEPRALRACGVRYSRVSFESTRAASRAERTALERKLPRGTRVYVGPPTAIYVVEDGSASFGYPATATFVCQSDGFLVRARDAGLPKKFRKTASVVYEPQEMIVYVAPGQMLSADIRTKIARGYLRLQRTLE
jgi:hypothetical protein